METFRETAVEPGIMGDDPIGSFDESRDTIKINLVALTISSLMPVIAEMPGGIDFAG